MSPAPVSKMSCGKPAETSSVIFAPFASALPAGGIVPMSVPGFAAE
jgi:hypothetical protein